MLVAGRYGSFEIPDEKDLVANSLRLYGEWAQSEIDALANFIQEGSVVVDVGAFIGTHSRAFSGMNRAIASAISRSSAAIPIRCANGATWASTNPAASKVSIEVCSAIRRARQAGRSPASTRAQTRGSRWTRSRASQPAARGSFLPHWPHQSVA